MTTKSRATKAVLAARQNDFATARTTVIDLVAEDYANADAHRAWGHVLLSEGKTVDAIAALRMSLDLDDSSADAHFDYAVALLRAASRDSFLALSHCSDALAAIKAGLDRTTEKERGLRLLAEAESKRAELVD